jgi:hypothetical protein
MAPSVMEPVAAFDVPSKVAPNLVAPEPGMSFYAAKSHISFTFENR